MDHPDLHVLAKLVLCLPDAERAAFDHLFTCTGCRQRLVWAKAAAETQGRPLEETRCPPAETGREAAVPCQPAETGGEAAVLDRVKVVADRQDARWRGDREQAGRLYDELVALPEVAWGTAVEQERFSSPGLADLLLAASAETVGSDAPRAEKLAALALDIAGGVDGGSFGGSLVRRLHARCLCALGEARRRQGDSAAAERAFEVAGRRLGDEPMDIEERAQACRLLARLRADQERLDEAFGLLERAATLYAGLARFRELGEVLGEQGLLYLSHGEAHAALPLLREAVGHVEASPRPRAAIELRLGLARCYAELDQPAEADAALGAARKLYPLFGRRERLAFLHAEAGIDALCHRLLKAVSKLTAVVHRLGAVAPYDAAAAALDLAEIYLERGMREPLLRLGGELALLLASPEFHPRARLVLAVTLAVLARSPDVLSSDLVERAARYFALARHAPERAFERPEGIPFELPWDELDPESLRRDLCAVAGLPEEMARLGAAEIDPASRERLAAVCEEILGVRIVFGELGAGAEPS
jgi:tetratricopeptide (TPR) repeat protein